MVEEDVKLLEPVINEAVLCTEEIIKKYWGGRNVFHIYVSKPGKTQEALGRKETFSNPHLNTRQQYQLSTSILIHHSNPYVAHEEEIKNEIKIQTFIPVQNQASKIRFYFDFSKFVRQSLSASLKLDNNFYQNQQNYFYWFINPECNIQKIL